MAIKILDPSKQIPHWANRKLTSPKFLSGGSSKLEKIVPFAVNHLIAWFVLEIQHKLVKTSETRAIATTSHRAGHRWQNQWAHQWDTGVLSKNSNSGPLQLFSNLSTTLPGYYCYSVTHLQDFVSPAPLKINLFFSILMRLSYKSIGIRIYTFALGFNR